ncbi:MAG: tripartite tricarboxylate transporter substrate binding protein [Burkholderiales bacterium]|nr:tripartite tricarboxylate transporter substrate binding protein [Burkholderiales bacterium]
MDQPLFPVYRVLALISVAFSLFGAAQPAAAQSAFPSKTVRLVVPFAPGGGNDIVGRALAQKLAEGLGQSVVVDNRGGAGSTIGTDIVAKSPPDGHTLLVNNIALAVNATLFAKLPYDTLRDLAPVTRIGGQANVLIVHPALPVKSVRELVALARSRPGEIAYASGGIGSAGHLATTLLQMSTQIRMSHVPYKGLGPALIDLMGGHAQILISTIASGAPYIKSGRVRPLAVTTARRAPVLPQVPTMIEAGVAGYEFSTWYGLFVAGTTPRPIVDRLNQEAAKALGATDLTRQLAAQGIEAGPTSVEEFTAYFRSEVAKWGKVVKQSGAKVE